MEHPVIRVLFEKDPWSFSGFLVRLFTGSKYTHVDVVLNDVMYRITLKEGSLVFPLDTDAKLENYDAEVRIPLPSNVSLDDLEFPNIVLFQRISILETIKYHILRTLFYRYRLTTPVVNCVTMVNIILNHNLNTCEFNGYTPDELYAKARRAEASYCK